MNISTALASGKPVRLPEWSPGRSMNMSSVISATDAVRTDWEVAGACTMVTAAILKAAWPPKAKAEDLATLEKNLGLG